MAVILCLLVLFFHAVLGNFPRDCNVHSVSMHCGRVYVETEMIFPLLENLQIEEMMSFHASKDNFPKLRFLYAKKTRTTCTELVNRLPGVEIEIGGNTCPQVCFLICLIYITIYTLT